MFNKVFESCYRVVVVCGAFGLPTAFPCGHRCTVGIDRDPPVCLDAQGGIKARLQPFCGWCCLEVMWSWTWSERCVVVNILSDVGTENTHTPARVEALFASHESRSKFPGERLSSQCFVKRSAVVCFVSSSMFVLSL